MRCTRTDTFHLAIASSKRMSWSALEYGREKLLHHGLCRAASRDCAPRRVARSWGPPAAERPGPDDDDDDDDDDDIWASVAFLSRRDTSDTLGSGP